MSIVRKINRKPRVDTTAHDEQRNSSYNVNNDNNNNDCPNYEKKPVTQTEISTVNLFHYICV